MQRVLLGCLVLQVAACGSTTSDPEPEEPIEVTGSCTLSLVASGSIPDTELVNARFSGPALVAVEDAFLIGWRENTGAKDVFKVARIEDAGTLEIGASSHPISCVTQGALGEVGLSYSEGVGLMVAALPVCKGSGAGALLQSFDAYGSGGSFEDQHDATLTSATTHTQPVAPAHEIGAHHFVYVAGSSARLALVEGAHEPGVPAWQPSSDVQLFDSAAVEHVHMTSTDRLVAIAGGIPSLGAVELAVFEQGPDLAPIGQRTLPSADWIALAADGSRVVTLAPSAMGPALFAVEAGKTGLSDRMSGFIAEPTPSAGAIALHRGRSIVALGTPGSIRVQQSGGISASAETSTTLSDAAYAGQTVALAAARNRVAVAWLNEAGANGSASPGGWAVLECGD